jgi:precorrin-3B synthase
VEAADGHLARVRLPGGLITAGQLRALARLAAELGDGRAELTSRGNIQLRALPAGAAGRLTAELAAAGMLPSLDHDRVRNILASPLAGLDDGGPHDLTPVVAALDSGLCARPRLARLSGRFLFAIDDGRGDVAGLGADVVAVVRADVASVNGLAIGRPSIRGVTPAGGPFPGAAGWPDAIAAVMLEFAEAFLDERAAKDSKAWRIADLPGGAERVRSAVAERLALTAAPVLSDSAVAATTVKVTSPASITSSASIASDASAGTFARPVGVVGRGTAVLLAPLGRLAAAQLDWLAGQVTGRPVRVTPWRSVVLPGLADPAGTLREAAGLGFGVDEQSPWLRVTACAGQPGCASALADVQADAASFAGRWPGRIVHVSGCARHCGRPAATEVDVTATSEGYEIAGI